MEEVIRQYLDARSIPRKSRGYQFLIKVVADTIRDPTTIYHYMKWLNDTAIECGLNPSNIDRVMRYAVSKNNDISLCEFIIEASIQVKKKKKKKYERRGKII